MTHYKFTINCDYHIGETNCQSTATFQGNKAYTYFHILREAREDGWVFIKDCCYCPICAKLESVVEMKEAQRLEHEQLDAKRAKPQMTDVEIMECCREAAGFKARLLFKDYLNSRDAICELWEKQDDFDISMGLGVCFNFDAEDAKSRDLPTARKYATAFAIWWKHMKEMKASQRAQIAKMTSEERSATALINPAAWKEATEGIK